MADDGQGVRRCEERSTSPPPGDFRHSLTPWRFLAHTPFLSNMWVMEDSVGEPPNCSPEDSFDGENMFRFQTASFRRASGTGPKHKAVDGVLCSDDDNTKHLSFVQHVMES